MIIRTFKNQSSTTRSEQDKWSPRKKYETLNSINSLPIFVILHLSLLFAGTSKHTIFSQPTLAPDDHPFPSAPWFFKDYDAL